MNENSEHWLQLSRWFAERADGRRSREWKVTLGFWAVLVATAYSQMTFQAPSIATGWWVLAWAVFLFCWVRGAWVANENDNARAAAFLKLATSQRTGAYTELPGISPHDWRWWFGFAGNWSSQFQALATGGIMMAISKGKRDALGIPRGCENFWWGEHCLVTWAVVALLILVLWGAACMAYCRYGRGQ